jgi:hypothetical protein
MQSVTWARTFASVSVPHRAESDQTFDHLEIRLRGVLGAIGPAAKKANDLSDCNPSSTARFEGASGVTAQRLPDEVAGVLDGVLEDHVILVGDQDEEVRPGGPNHIASCGIGFGRAERSAIWRSPGPAWTGASRSAA